ncbi:unnamed protein product, partial [Closterium sp. Yama58-4]
ARRLSQGWSPSPSQSQSQSQLITDIRSQQPLLLPLSLIRTCSTSPVAGMVAVAVAARDIAWLLLVGAVWGITNPLIKRGAAMSKRHIKADESAAAAGKTAGLEASMSFSQKLDFRCRRFVHVVTRDWQ